MTVGLTPYQLRFCPASYLHEAHLPSSWAQVPELLPEWRTLPASNGALLEALTLGIGYEMPAPLGGLALFPQSELVLLLRRLGAVLHGEAIRRCLLAPTLRQIIALLGEEGHRAVLSQLDLLIGPWPAGWQQPLPAQLDEGGWKRRVCSSGWRRPGRATLTGPVASPCDFPLRHLGHHGLWRLISGHWPGRFVSRLPNR